MELQLWPKQGMALQTAATELLFGGAAGPGKSHLLRVAAVWFSANISGLQTYLFRRTNPDLVKNHLTGPTGLPAILAEWSEQGRAKINYGKNYIDFWNGSRIYLCHCQHEHDVLNYQGAEIHLLLMDELTHFTESIYRFLRGRVRLGGLKLPEEFVGLFPRITCGSNPGSAGHNWVKQTFIDNAPPYELKKMSPAEGGMLRQFIPALLVDNPTMMENDPEYADRLAGLGNPELVRAMLEGDWDIVAGGMLDDLWRRGIHVIDEPFKIPESWYVNRSFDWGSSKPFSVGWWAESDGTMAPNGRTYPRGTLFRFDEWYGWNGKANQGLKMLAVDIADGIKKREATMPHIVKPGPADTSIFDAENGVCIVDDMAKRGVRWEKADKSPGSRKTGWERLRKYLKASIPESGMPMEDPGIFIFSNCTQWIRTVPILPRSERGINPDPDDVDTRAEDHAGDETRYRIMQPRFGFGAISEDALAAMAGFGSGEELY